MMGQAFVLSIIKERAKIELGILATDVLRKSGNEYNVAAFLHSFIETTKVGDMIVQDDGIT